MQTKQGRQTQRTLKKQSTRRRNQACLAFLATTALIASLVATTVFIAVLPFCIYIMGAFSAGAFGIVGQSYWREANQLAKQLKASKKAEPADLDYSNTTAWE